MTSTGANKFYFTPMATRAWLPGSCMNPEVYSPPLCDVDWLYDPGYLVDERDGSSDVIQDVDVSYLFPWHWHVLK